jgi:hypothetical protein
MHQEDLDLELHDDGFAALKVRSVNEDDVICRSTLWVPRAAAGLLAGALRAATGSMADHTVTVSDGKYFVFSGAGQGPVSSIHVEMKRAVDAPHGGYDTLSLSRAGAARAAALLDGVAGA